MIDFHEIRLTSGIYDDLDDEIYHGDCCDGPSVSSTGLSMVMKDPAKYWDGSSLNIEVRGAKEKARLDAAKAGKVSAKRHFDRGKAAHILVLEPQKIVDAESVVPADILGANGSLGTNKARQFVGTQQARVRSVLKPDEWDTVCDMVESLGNHSYAMGLMEDFAIEQSHFWTNHKTGVYIKSRPDLPQPEEDRWIVDYKTTDAEDIDQWSKKSLCDFRLDMQAALQMWGVHEAHGFSYPGIAYLVQSTKTKRVAVRFLPKGSNLLAAARLDLREVLNTFALCWADMIWPSPWDAVEARGSREMARAALSTVATE